jgi:hypothetical protein
VPPPTIHISTECGHRFRDRSNFCARALATAYSHAALGEKVVSFVTKLEFCGVVFGRLDESLRDKLIKNSPFVRLQIRAGSLQ